VSHVDEVGDYRLSLEALSNPDAIAADPSTTAVLAVDGEARSAIDFMGDHDWFAVELEGGQTYQFDLAPDYDAPDPLYDPYLFLYDASGGYIDENDDSGGELHSRLYYTPNEDEFVFAAAAGFGGNTGSYIISARQVDRPALALADALPPSSTEKVSHDILFSPEVDWLA
jgi:hypothetical protein